MRGVVGGVAVWGQVRRAAYPLLRFELGQLRLDLLHLHLDLLEGERVRLCLVLLRQGDGGVGELLRNDAHDTHQLVATAHLLDEAALVERRAGVHVAELQQAHSAQLVHDRMGGVILDDELDELHVLGAPHVTHG